MKWLGLAIVTAIVLLFVFGRKLLAQWGILKQNQADQAAAVSQTLASDQSHSMITAATDQLQAATTQGADQVAAAQAAAGAQTNFANAWLTAVAGCNQSFSGGASFLGIGGSVSSGGCVSA